MFSILEIKSRYDLIWEDLPYIEAPAFAHHHAFKAIQGRDPYAPPVQNIEDFRRAEVPHYDPFFNHDYVENHLRRLFFEGLYFSISRPKIPLAPIFNWRPIAEHPDGGEWIADPTNYSEYFTQKLEEYAKYLGAQRRRKMAEQEEADATPAALVAGVKRVVEKRENVDANSIDKINALQSDSLIDSKANQSVRKPPTLEQIELAKSSGNTSTHIEAREAVVRHFLVNNEFTNRQIADALGAPDGSNNGGVDLRMPVEVITFPPPEKMTQYVKSHGFPGNWFDPLSSQTPDMLGISGETRTLKTFTVVPSKGLKTVAKPVIDDWTNPANPVPTSGGGVQVLVNDQTKNMISSINPRGV